MTAIARKTDRGHTHGEAFALMVYACDKCGFSQTYWNSRDGVTPLFCACPICKKSSMAHRDWNADRYVPNHIPEPEQGVWIDMPDSLKRPCAAAQIRSADGTEYELQGEEREEMIKNIVDDFRDGEPWLIRWPA